jgi:hypothetical protein
MMVYSHRNMGRHAPATLANPDRQEKWHRYDDLRAVCPAFPADVYNTLSSPGCVAAVMGHSAQAALANTLFHMKVRRSELLELPWVRLVSRD